MCVGRHLQANNFRRVRFDDDAVNRDDRIARQRIFPFFEFRCADVRRNEIHIADVALVLLKSGDLFRIGRPAKNRAVAVRPARVVGRVAEIFHAVGRQMRFFSGRNIAHPQIPIADKRRFFSVGRNDFIRIAVSASCPHPPTPNSFKFALIVREPSAGFISTNSLPFGVKT